MRLPEKSPTVSKASRYVSLQRGRRAPEGCCGIGRRWKFGRPFAFENINCIVVAWRSCNIFVKNVHWFLDASLTYLYWGAGRVLASMNAGIVYSRPSWVTKAKSINTARLAAADFGNGIHDTPPMAAAMNKVRSGK